MRLFYLTLQEKKRLLRLMDSVLVTLASANPERFWRCETKDQFCDAVDFLRPASGFPWPPHCRLWLRVHTNERPRPNQSRELLVRRSCHPARAGQRHDFYRLRRGIFFLPRRSFFPRPGRVAGTR